MQEPAQKAREIDAMSFEELAPPPPWEQDVIWEEWVEARLQLSASPSTVRRADPTPADSRRMRDLQMACEPITPRLLRENKATIAENQVFFAEIDRVPVGFIQVAINDAHPVLFAQAIGVVPQAQGRSIGRRLLTTAASVAPERPIVLATRDTNEAAHALINGFAASTGATVHQVSRGTYPDGLAAVPTDPHEAQAYEVWEIKRP